MKYNIVRHVTNTKEEHKKNVVTIAMSKNHTKTSHAIEGTRRKQIQSVNELP